ncbi:MAG: DUF4097 family beta strand repeat-containing protein [Acidobacteriota bacterium]
MRTNRTWLGALALMAALFIVAPVQGQERSFSGVEAIELDGVSGDVVVRAIDGDRVTVSVDHDIRPRGALETEIEQRGDRLLLREHWSGRNGSGHVEWTIGVPASLAPRIDIDTASGDLEVFGVEAEIRFDTASGDVRVGDATLLAGSALNTASGDLKLRGVRAGRGFAASTASGDVVIEDSHGVLDGSSASGEVTFISDSLDGPAEFSSASGSVEVRLGSPPIHALEASSASGDVILEAPFGADFTLVMTVRKDRGRIRGPFEYTEEETFERHGDTYERKIVVRGSGGPEIRLSTASGSIDVRETS